MGKISTTIKISARCMAALLTVILTASLSGCPEKKADAPETNYKIGTWVGSIKTSSHLVMRQGLEYWCAGWKVEVAEIRLDEFQDGSIKGTINGNLYVWEILDNKLLDFDTITSGNFTDYAVFSLDLVGEVHEDGYSLSAVDLPISLPNPNKPLELIDFWDFLFPSKIEGEWADGNRDIMSGQSIRVQGNDYRETAQLSTFREFSILYEWNLSRL